MPFVFLPFRNVQRPEEDPHWCRVCTALLKLQGNLELLHQVKNEEAERQCVQPVECWLPSCIAAYTTQADMAPAPNLDGLRGDDLFLETLLLRLPFIIEQALKLPEFWNRGQGEIPLLTTVTGLKQPMESKMMYLPRSLVCSLLANAFLCSFPARIDPYSTELDVNFWRLYIREPDQPVESLKVNREKIKCFLDYFRQMSTGQVPDTMISFERRAFKSSHAPKPWTESTHKLTALEVTSTGGIEDCDGMLQVAFSDDLVGANVLSQGGVENEIRFCLNPELVVSRLFTERLADNEVLVVTGTRQFTSYQGHSQDFTWKPLLLDEGRQTLQLDSMNRESTQIVVMDPIHFYPASKHLQYGKLSLERELGKCYTGFMPEDNGSCGGVATGNWGGGKFNGNPVWKLLVQWIGASLHKRQVKYFAKDEEQKREFDKIRDYLWEKREEATLSRILEIMVRYGQVAGYKQKMSVFSFLKRKLEGKSTWVG